MKSGGFIMAAVTAFSLGVPCRAWAAERGDPQRQCKGGEIDYGSRPQACGQLTTAEDCGRFRCFWDGSYNGTQWWCDGGAVDYQSLPRSCEDLGTAAACLSYSECSWE